MDLRKRLAQLDRLTKKPETESPPEAIAPATLAVALRRLGLQEVAGECGKVWVREYRDRVPRPGRLPYLAGFFTRADEADPRSEELLFIDLETTGLAGGTGTLAFLVGASWWTRGALATRQYFLASPAQEPEMLARLAELAAGFRVVVSFNGASFDLPLLRTRALMNRVCDPLADLVSWDLLVPARRLWGRRLENCRQQTLETAVCGLDVRTGDIDGSQIPAVWFEFLAGGRTDELERVLCHNHLDMSGMARLFGHVAERARTAVRGGAGVEEGDWHDAWALGRICELRREREAAIAWLRRAYGAARAADGECDGRFVRDAVRILKRSADWRLVEDLIGWGLAHDSKAQWLHREAAILYERRLGDLEKALAHAVLCGENARIERLRRRLAAPAQEVSG